MVNLDVNTKTNFRKVFTVKKNYDNITIAYGIGYNNYENGIISQNVSNFIRVENSALINIKDYDYNSLEFTELPKSQFSGYENYFYNKISNINIVQSESRVDFGIDTICVNVTTKAIAVASGIYETYLNDVKSQPYTVEADVWYHLDYTKLIYEYNIIKTIDGDGEIAAIVIKNKNVTDYRSNKLYLIETYESESNTDDMNLDIEIAKKALKNATTIKEIDTEVEKFRDNFAFSQKKVSSIEEIKNLVGENLGNNVEILLTDSTERINSATDETKVNEVVNNFKSKLPIARAKDEAIEILKNYVGQEYSDSIKSIYEKAIEDINNATTVDEINKILEQAKNSINVQKETNIDNPLTLDNIVLYLFMFLSSTVIIIVLKKKLLIKNSTN